MWTKQWRFRGRGIPGLLVLLPLVLALFIIPQGHAAPQAQTLTLPRPDHSVVVGEADAIAVRCGKAESGRGRDAALLIQAQNLQPRISAIEWGQGLAGGAVG